MFNFINLKKSFLIGFLIFSHLVTAEEKLAKPDYLERSNEILTETVKKNNQSNKTDEYKKNSSVLIEDAFDSIKDLKKGKEFNDSNPTLNLQKYLTEIEKPSKSCDSNTNLTSCEVNNIEGVKKAEMYIFVSSSMPKELLIQAFDMAAHYNARVVIRGVLEGKNLIESTKMFAEVRALTKLSPDFSIDPRPFNEFKIKSVPSIAISYLSDHLTMTGSINLEYLQRKFNEGASGEIPKSGSTYDILEKDFVADMEDRAKKVDFQALAKKGVNGIWKNQSYSSLPKASAQKVIEYDPSFIVKDDVSLPDGRIIATAGTRYNPQMAVPLSKTLIFFDARDQKQIDFSKKLVQQHFDQNKNFSLITTNLPETTNWDSYNKLRDELGGRLFVSNPKLLERFRIQSLPSTIEGSGTNLKLTEYAIP